MRTSIRAAGVIVAAAAWTMAPGAGASDRDATQEAAGIEAAGAATAAAPAQPADDGDWLARRVVGERELAAQRGGADLHVNENNATATVQDNVARNLTTGNNTIAGSAFANTNGVPMVVQNSGNNVVIQNSTILNLQMQ